MKELSHKQLPTVAKQSACAHFANAFYAPLPFWRVAIQDCPARSCRDVYSIEQLAGGRRGRFTTAGRACIREDLVLVRSLNAIPQSLYIAAYSFCSCMC
jgi:hypothetical protein